MRDSVTRSTDTEKLIVLDLAGPFIKTPNGNQHLVISRNEETNHYWAGGVKERTSPCIMGYLNRMLRELNPLNQPVKLHMDNAGELISQKTQDWLAERNVTCHYSAPRRPNSNSLAELAVQRTCQAVRTVLTVWITQVSSSARRFKIG